jgi:predicted unusual protein kinase regulating ubiquinone biosynthesis (AarF/ABC1/UbiB family)
MITALFHLARTARVGFVLAREGALALIDPSALPPLARAAIRLGRLIERRGAGSSATRLAAALTRLGPSYVKFGQFLATRPDVVGMRIASDLSALQDRMEPFPTAQARAAIEAAHGRPVEDIFAEFGPPGDVHPDDRRGRGAAFRLEAVRFTLAASEARRLPSLSPRLRWGGLGWGAVPLGAREVA